MNAKRYSIGVSLFAALLLNGCGQKTVKSGPYDLPVLLNSNFEQAQTRLGKPTQIFKDGDGKIQLANWKKNGKETVAAYNTRTGLPFEINFINTDQKARLDKQAFLDLTNLNPNDSNYKTELFAAKDDASKVVTVIVTPNFKQR